MLNEHCSLINPNLTAMQVAESTCFSLDAQRQVVFAGG